MRDFGEQVSAKKPPGCLKYFLYAGCATFTLIAIGNAILPALLVFLLQDSEPEPGWEKTLLPEKIHHSKVLLTQHQRGGFLENCVFVAYELAPDTARAIKNQGSDFLKGVGQP